MKARIFPKLEIPDDLYNLEQFIGHYDTVKEQIEFLKYVKLEMELYYEPRFEGDVDMGEVKEYEELDKVLDKKIKFYEEILNNESEKNGQINESRVKNLNNRDTEKVFQECLERGTNYYLGHKHKRLHLIYFFMEMKKYFGEDIELIQRVFYKIVNDNPVIKIFGYDYNVYREKIENCKNKIELANLFENEKNNTEELQRAINDYKPEYYIKWEKVNNGKVYEEDLDEKGYVDNNDSDFEKHNKAWVKYFIEDVKNKKLREMLIYGFSGQMDESEDIDNNKSVKLFLDQIENELKTYKDEVVQAYLIKNTNLEKDEIDIKLEKKPKKNWKKNKSEFARFINEEYEKNNENYKSLRDASNKLFEEYKFDDKNWTKEKCYDLVRQT